MQKSNEAILESLLKRRSFLKNTGIAGLGVAGTALLGTAGLSAIPTAASGVGSPVTLSANDVAILNFALNLEYLEANFYTEATTGKSISEIGIPVTGVGRQGQVTGGQQVNFDGNPDNVMTIAQQIAEDEQQHVVLLRTLLGSKAIAQPEINLAALGTVSTLDEFLAEARAFEDVGVSAYGGAAPLIQSKTVLAIAARIALTEGEHTGNLRLLVALNRVPTMKVDAQDILPPPSGTEYFSNVNGLTIVRTTSEVLAILYGNGTPGTDSGGFFPNGVNGSINTVA
jgi:hypothetical protein